MFNKTNGIFGAVILAATLGAISPAVASSVNGTGLITSEVIYGGGNANGAWTGENSNGFEVALRGKLRFGANGQSVGTNNYDGDHTYTFNLTDSSVPAGWSVFNFDFSVNVNANDDVDGFTLDQLDYLLRVDTDPTNGTNFFEFNPIIGPFAIPDNALGDNSTSNGAGSEDQSLVDSASVAQNSHNLGFGYPIADPQAAGIFTFEFLVRTFATVGEGALPSIVLAQTSIDVIVGAPSAVPVPAALPLFGTGIALMGLVGWRRKKKAAKNAAT